jgi:hypothetical protein
MVEKKSTFMTLLANFGVIDPTKATDASVVVTVEMCDVGIAVARLH